ncbi:transglutaminase-like domain-containing protein [Mangrovibacterium lignilyticum]|uniref:transglutaminase-like domain-containing protein n=1 Tax=Mangrovibacterium lignilyticum TaxID=2668052 RepID=UPI0013D66596|nr:transglutaminase-like domain-containing protein [Mangrovibacterium lignilyticum]
MDSEKLQALISLLDDPDQAVFEMVEKELLKEDALQVEELEHIWETSLDELMQNRIEDLIQQIQFRETSKKIKSWTNQEEVDLFEGFFLISQYQYPDLKLKNIQSQLKKISSDVWLEINNRLTSIEKITVLNHILYDVNKFAINHSNPTLPQNCYLNLLLETKKGNPVSLAILYTIIARDLGFPVQLIDFPQNPLVAYVDAELAKKTHGEDYDSPVLFYINPANNGAIIGRKEIEFFMKKNEKIDEMLFQTPCEDRKIIKLLLANLIEAYEAVGYKEKVNDLSSISDLL